MPEGGGTRPILAESKIECCQAHKTEAFRPTVPIGVMPQIRLVSAMFESAGLSSPPLSLVRSLPVAALRFDRPHS